MRDYTALALEDGGIAAEPIVRGYAWPAGGRPFVLRLPRDDGWNNGEDGWTWKLLFDRQAAGGTPTLTVTASAAAISGDDNEFLDLAFALSDEDSAALPGAGQTTVQVDLQSDDGSGNLSLWSEAHGEALVRSAVGGVI